MHSIVAVIKEANMLRDWHYCVARGEEALAELGQPQASVHLPEVKPRVGP